MGGHNGYRQTWVEVDVSAIKRNIEKLNGILPANGKMMAVVKANGYGHGSVEAAKIAVSCGIDFLMVALLEEAIHLRESGIDVPILVIGRVAPRDARLAAEYEVTLAVFDLAWLHGVREEVFPGELKIHLEFETGMGRTGICREAELISILDEARQNKRLKITGVYTHLATADEVDSALYTLQKQRFTDWLRLFKENYAGEVLVHLGNSAAGIQYPAEMKQYTRFGVAMYGMYPSAAMRALASVKLEAAFSLMSELVQVKLVKKGTPIGYGSTYIARQDEWIGTIPLGYADGWRRSLQGFSVIVGGRRQEIVGRICMDQTMIKLDKQYEIGTRVTLIGRDGDEEITVDEVADHLETINYEVTCMISNRVPRVYVK